MPATILILSSAPFRTDYPGLFRASIPAPEDGWDVSYALLRNGLMTSEVFPQRNPDVPIAIGFVPASDGGIRHDPNPENQSKRSGLQGQVIHRKRLKRYPHPLGFGFWFVNHMRVWLPKVASHSSKIICLFRKCCRQE